jgi:hypothetical protein
VPSKRLRLLSFGEHYRRIAEPFDRTFTRTDLNRVLDRVSADEPRLRLVA